MTYHDPMKDRSDLGTFRRFFLMLFGLWLASSFNKGTPLGFVVGVFGVVVFVAASGLLELAMALWYRSRRRALRRANAALG